MAAQITPNHRFAELDSLRGLAALTVMFGHFLNIFIVSTGPYARVGSMVQSVKATPLFVLFAGHEAVMLFFVLSGFVLSLQFLKGRTVLRGFLIRRVFRIYVPYLVALLVALSCCALVYRGRNGDLSEWFNTPWSRGIELRGVVQHLLMLSHFQSDRFNPVLWSLVHEMRISLLFPLLVTLLLKVGWKTGLVLALGLSLVGLTGTLMVARLDRRIDELLTVHYIGMFVVGFLLARNIDSIRAAYSALTTAGRIGLALVGLALYTYGHALPGKLSYFIDIPIAVGAALLVVTAVCSWRLSALMRLKVIKFFGDISYSLYLYHAIVLLTLLHLLYGKLPLVLILALSVALSLLVSHLSYRFVELTAIKVGKSLAERPLGMRLRRRRASRAARAPIPGEGAANKSPARGRGSERAQGSEGQGCVAAAASEGIAPS